MKQITLLCLVLLILGCQEEKPNNIVVQKEVSYRIPSFNKDSAFAYVKKQLDFGPRDPGSEGHAACADWLLNKLTSFGLQAEIEPFTAKRFDGKEINGKNIIGRINPNASRRIFISAHWDTRFRADEDPNRPEEPILGADDGASGVAVALEIARNLARLDGFDLGVDIVLFDAEDQGENDGQVGTWGIGAQHWSERNKSRYNPEYGILLDMVGARNARFMQEEWSRRTAPAVVNKIWNLASKMGYGTVFVNSPGRGVIDDHYFINQNAGWPVVDIINISGPTKSGFGTHWHTHNDNLDIIDPNVMRTVGKVVIQLLCQEEQNRI